jgi:hypothetical protein
MVPLHKVEEQLVRIGCNFRVWGRPEIRELRNILTQDEVIAGCTNGRYSGGGALLVVTNHRLLLVDRKPLFLTVEDIRFDMITEIDFNARLLNSTAYVITPTRKLVFSSWNQHRLRTILNYTQQQVMEIRQRYMQQQFTHNNRQTDPQIAAGVVGGLAMQGNMNGSGQRTLPYYNNPYTKGPLTIRRNKPSRFY